MTAGFGAGLSLSKAKGCQLLDFWGVDCGLWILHFALFYVNEWMNEGYNINYDEQAVGHCVFYL